MWTRISAGCIFSLCLLFALAASADDSRIAVIELRHQTAEQLIPQLQPVISDSVSLSGSGFQLLARGTDKQIKEIESLLARLDVPPQKLRIEVEQTDRYDALHSEQGVDGEVRIGTETQIRGNVRIGRAGSTGDANRQWTVQALSGRPAMIAEQIQVPVWRSVVTQNRYGRETQGVERVWLNAQSGLYARATTSGSTVHIDLMVEDSDIDKQQRRTGLRVVSSLRGQTGQWIDVGSVDNQADRQTRGLTVRSDDSRREGKRIRFRVTLLH